MQNGLRNGRAVALPRGDGSPGVMASAWRATRSLGAALLAAALVAACGGGGGGEAGGGGGTGTAPSITSQPAAQSSGDGGTVVFSVTASGDAPLSYQWQKNATNIAGATNASLTVVAAAADDGATYRVVVSNAAGSVTSASAQLTVTSGGMGTLNGIGVSAADASVWLPVTANVPGRPAATSTATQSFNIQGVPASERIVLRTDAPDHLTQFRIAAVRSGAVSFERSTLLPLGAGGTIAPATGGTVSVAGSAGQVVFPAGAFETANTGAPPTGNVTVSATVIAGARQPDRIAGDSTALEGGMPVWLDSLGALAIGLSDSNAQSLRLAAGKQAVYRIPVSTRDTAALPSSAPVYRFDSVTGRWAAVGLATLGGAGNARYFETTLGVHGYLQVARPVETIRVIGCTQFSTFRTRNRSVRTEGIDYTFTGYAYTDFNGNFSVPVKKDGRAVLTATGGTETIAPIVVGPSATDITLPGCQMERGSNTAAPSFIEAPQSQTVAPGASVRLHVVADGRLPMGLQWQRNGVPIAGETGTALSFVASASDNGAVFTVVATNAAGSTTSSAATLTVTGGGGGGTAAACFTGLPAEGARFLADFDLKNNGTSYGTRTFDTTMGGSGTFEGVTARFATVVNTSRTTTNGVTTDVTVNNTTYVNETGPGEVTRYGQEGTSSTTTNGTTTPGTTKIVNTPPWADRVPGLAVGESITQSFTTVITGSSGGVAFGPITSTTTQTTTLVAIESLAVPAGTFQACKYTSDTAGSLITFWTTVGTGYQLKIISGAFSEEATSVQITP